MRLLNTSTLQLEEFFDSKIPNYAILSHRWEKEEVTINDLREGRGPSMAGYGKIVGCCRQAVEDGLRYAWVDSCCIDKSSSAELSEAINSMFRWYRDAKLCYAYLSDVPTGKHSNDHYSMDSAFRLSIWWTRGWTLQELLAPELLIFYDKAWIEIDSKFRLSKIIMDITGITHLYEFSKASVAQKMSWASKRQTTRVEDQAYCLMGLFDVNMPLMYGEGEKAFQRLQLVIIGQTSDESIFAWSKVGELDVQSAHLLALMPLQFRNSGDVVRSAIPGLGKAHYLITNKGLRMERETMTRFTGIILPLRCERLSVPGEHVILCLTKGVDDEFEIFNDEYLRTKKIYGLSEPRIWYIAIGKSTTSKPLPKRLISVRMNCISAQLRGFNINLDNSDVRHWTLSSTEREFETLWLDMLELPVELFFIPLNGEQDSQDHFTMALYNFQGVPRVGLYLGVNPDIPQNWYQNDQSRLDKLSLRLASGRSVSFVLTRFYDNTKARGDYTVVVVVGHPDGALPWPDPVDLLSEAKFGTVD